MRLANAKDELYDVKTKQHSWKRQTKLLRSEMRQYSFCHNNIPSIKDHCKSKLEGLKLHHRTEEEKISGEHVIYDIWRKILLNRENMNEYINYPTRKVRSLEVAIANVKQKFRDSKLKKCN